MTKRIILLLILNAITTIVGVAQGRKANWLLGFQSGQIGPTTSNRATVDFQSGSPVVIPTTRKMKVRETQGNISDSNGNLLMSSNGIWIANVTGDTMLNGNGLNPNQFTIDWANTSVSCLNIQYANIFLPYPDSTNLYGLVHMTGNYNTNSSMSLSGRTLYYSLIDITQDSGMGAVISKNQAIFNDTLTWGISACKHANGRDWWIVAIRNNSNTLITTILTPTGFMSTNYQHFGGIISDIGNSCQPTFSLDGSKFAFTTGAQTGSGYDINMNLFDFDRCTGVFSNHRRVHSPDSTFSVGTAFSSNSKYLYTCSTKHIFQINTDSTILQMDSVATYDGFVSVQGTNFYTMFLAADKKIYVTSIGSVVDHHVINYPDSAGLASDVQQHSLNIPCLNFGSVPNHPNYFLGAEPGTICDSLTTSIHDSKFDSKKSLSISPNPATNFITVNAMNVKGSIALLNIYNSFGELTDSRNLNIYGGFATQDIYIETLPAGIYIVRLESEKDVFVGKFVKEER